MRFEESKTVLQTGMVIGYLLSYLLFTVALFFLLKLTHKLPITWNIIPIAIITASISLVGYIIQRLLK